MLSCKSDFSKLNSDCPFLRSYSNMQRSDDRQALVTIPSVQATDRRIYAVDLVSGVVVHLVDLEEEAGLLIPLEASVGMTLFEQHDGEAHSICEDNTLHGLGKAGFGNSSRA